MKNVMAKKPELYYQVQKPDYDAPWNGNYQSARVLIYEIDQQERENLDRYYPGENHIGTDNMICAFKYQRDRTRDINGDETFDPDKKVTSVWYAEEIDQIKRGWSGINVKALKRLVKILEKMEKVHDSISDKGLLIEGGDDQLKLRVFLLKELGAAEVYYSNTTHQVYRGCTA